MNAGVTVRENLKNMSGGERFSFEATFEKVGVDRRFPHLGKILLTSILLVETINGALIKTEVTDHAWVPKSKRWNGLFKNSLESKTSLSFTSEVKPYIKEGKNDFFTDYGLSNLRSVQLV